MVERVSPTIRGLPYLDTNVFLRLLTGDVPEQQDRARQLFKRIESRELTVVVPLIVISECIHSLSSPRLYHLPKERIVGLLRPLLRMPCIRLVNRQTVLRALELYISTNLGYGDSYILASMECSGSATIYSFDRGFDRVESVKRLEP